MHAIADFVELLKTHDQRLPLVRIDPVGFSGHQDRRIGMNPYDAHLDAERAVAQDRIVVRDAVNRLHPGFKLNRTLFHARGAHNIRRDCGKSGRANLFFSNRYPRRSFPGGTGSVPVVRASLSTAPAMSTEGRFKTHSPVRFMFSGVFELASRPSMQRHPSQKADDIGARLCEPSAFSELIRTTGVPK